MPEAQSSSLKAPNRNNALTRILLFPLNVLFSSLVALKNWLYAHHMLKGHRLEQPVISIGNLAMGGTGKTPITADLASILADQGYRVAILSRGYGRLNPKQALKVNADTSWTAGGDEPKLHALRADQNGQAIEVCVGPSRWKAAECAMSRPDIFLIDDGFQHRQLHRDLDIVLIDTSQPFPPCFPFFPFREGLASLNRANLVVLTRCDDPLRVQTFQSSLKRQFPNLPVLKSQFVLIDPVWPFGPPSDPGRKDVLAYSGIERPQKFFDALKSIGFRLRATLSLRDHQPLTKTAMSELESMARDHDVYTVLTTEKDIVKLQNPVDSAIIFGFLPMTTRWEDPTQLKNHLVIQNNKE